MDESAILHQLRSAILAAVPEVQPSRVVVVCDWMVAYGTGRLSPLILRCAPGIDHPGRLEAGRIVGGEEHWGTHCSAWEAIGLAVGCLLGEQ